MDIKQTLTTVVISILIISLLTVVSVDPVSAEEPNQDVDMNWPSSTMTYYQNVSDADEEEDVFGEIDNELSLAARPRIVEDSNDALLLLDITAIGYSEMEQDYGWVNWLYYPYSVEVSAELDDDSYGILQLQEEYNAGLNVYGDDKEGHDINDYQTQLALGAASLVPKVGPAFGVANLGLTVADAMHNEGLDDYETGNTGWGVEIGAECRVDRDGPYEELYEEDEEIAFAFSTQFQWRILDDYDD